MMNDGGSPTEGLQSKEDETTEVIGLGDRVGGLLLTSWAVSAWIFPKLGYLGRKSGRVIIHVLLVLIGVPILAPLLITRRVFPATEPVLTPIIWFVRNVFHWWPLSLWDGICGTIDWTVKWAVIATAVVLNVSIKTIMRLIKLGWDDLTKENIMVYVRRTVFYVAGAGLFILGVISQVALWVGFLFQWIDEAIDRLIRMVISEKDVEQLQADIRFYILRHPKHSENLMEIGASDRYLLDERTEEKRRSEENISRGEFLISIFIAILALSLSFFSNMENILIYEGVVLSYRIRLNLLFTLQIIIFTITMLLLISVVIRTRLIDYLSAEDVSIFDEREDILTAYIIDQEIGRSLKAIFMGIIWNEAVNEFAHEIDYERSAETTGLPVRDTLLYYIREDLKEAVDEN